MIKCVRCGNENASSSQYCDECGAALSAEKPESVGTTKIENPPEATAFAVEPIIPRASWFKEAGDAAKTAAPSAKLTIERGKSVGKEFFLSEDEMLIGRWDADNGIFPDIDLDADDPEAKVSRRHARIVREGARFLIEDLGSTNGTFVNRGRRLLPGNRHLLNDGDEIIVGKTFLRFQLLK